MVASNATLENMHSPGGYLSECSESDAAFSAASPQSVMSRASSTSTQASVIKINTNYIGDTLNKMELESSSPELPSSPESVPVGDVDIKIEEPDDDEVIMTHRTEVSYEEISEWCTVHYYEMNCRYGDPFQGNRVTLTLCNLTP